jgi:hypothetical protein
MSDWITIPIVNTSETRYFVHGWPENWSVEYRVIGGELVIESMIRMGEAA